MVNIDEFIRHMFKNTVGLCANGIMNKFTL